MWVILPLGNPVTESARVDDLDLKSWDEKNHQPTNPSRDGGWLTAKKTHWIHGFWDTGIAWFEGMQMFF